MMTFEYEIMSKGGKVVVAEDVIATVLINA